MIREWLAPHTLVHCACEELPVPRPTENGDLDHPMWCDCPLLATLVANAAFRAKGLHLCTLLPTRQQTIHACFLC